MALTQSQRLQQFATSLSNLTGLTYDASYKWASAEVGLLNNLGIMAGGKPVAYATPQEGAAAAASLINSSSYYAGIRASIGKGTEQQLLAIAQSPWRLGVSGLAKWGGQDPYYLSVFGITGSQFTVPGKTGAHGEPLLTTAQTAADAAAAGMGPVDKSTSPTTLASVGNDIFSSVQNAIGFIGVLLVGIVFILGAFLLSGKNKSQVVIV